MSEFNPPANGVSPADIAEISRHAGMSQGRPEVWPPAALERIEMLRRAANVINATQARLFDAMNRTERQCDALRRQVDALLLETVNSGLDVADFDLNGVKPLLDAFEGLGEGGESVSELKEGDLGGAGGLEVSEGASGITELAGGMAGGMAGGHESKRVETTEGGKP